MKAIYLRFHRWRGFMPAADPDLFFFNLGLVTLVVCKICLVDARQKLKTVIQTAIEKPPINPDCRE